MVRFIRSGVCATLSLVFASMLFAAPWMGGRGVGNAGAYADTPFPNLPTLAWKTSLGLDYHGQTPSNGLLSGGTFIVAFGKKLVGISIETGELRWSKDLADTPIGGILLLHNKVIVTTAGNGVFAFNPDDGALYWKRILFNHVINGPLASDDALVYATKGATLDVLDPRNGVERTTIELHDEIEAAPLQIGDAVFLCYQSGRIVRMTGTLDSWTARLPQEHFIHSPVQNGRTVLVYSDDTIYSINVGSMTNPIAWSYTCRDMLPDGVTLEGATAYVATTGGRLHALDTKTGRDLWGKDGVTLPAPAIAAPLLIGDQLFVCMKNGLLATYARDSGQLSWRYRLAAEGKTMDTTAGLPVTDGKQLFFADSNGTVYRFGNLIPDTDSPTFRAVLPTLAGFDFSNVNPLPYVGAIIEDEGSGIKPESVTMRLDGEDLTPRVRYDLASGYWYASLPTPALFPGMHRLEMSATDYHNNQGTLDQIFFEGNSAKSERLQISINAQFLPARLKVRPGAILQWINRGGSLRTVVADGGTFTSDTLYPRGIPDGESFAWVVPLTTPPGTMMFYHCRLLGAAGDGTVMGTGLAGVIEVVDPRNSGPGFPDLNGLALPGFPMVMF